MDNENEVKPDEKKGVDEITGQEVPVVEEGTRVKSRSLGGRGLLTDDGKLVFILENPEIEGSPIPESGQYAVVYVNAKEPLIDRIGGIIPFGIGGRGDAPEEKPTTPEEKDDIAETLVKNAEKNEEENKDKRRWIIPIIALAGAALLAVSLRSCSQRDNVEPTPPEPPTKVVQVVETKNLTEEYMATDNSGEAIYYVGQADGQEELIGNLNGYKLYNSKVQTEREEQGIQLYQQISDIDRQIDEAFAVLGSKDATAEEKSEAWAKISSLNSQKLELTRNNRDLLLEGVDGFEEASRKTEDSRTEDEIKLVSDAISSYDRTVSTLEANEEMFGQIAEYQAQGYSFEVSIQTRPDNDRFITLDGQRIVEKEIDTATGKVISEKTIPVSPEKTNEEQTVGE